jgi:hypothetical protein
MELIGRFIRWLCSRIGIRSFSRNFRSFADNFRSPTLKPRSFAHNLRSSSHNLPISSHNLRISSHNFRISSHNFDLIVFEEVCFSFNGKYFKGLRLGFGWGIVTHRCIRHKR